MKAFFILLLTTISISFTTSAQLFTFSFNGTGTCPTQGSNLSSQPANATVSAVIRVGTLSCSAANDVFSSTGWSGNTSIDASQYIEITVTAAAGYIVNTAAIGFSAVRSPTGPANGRVAHDGGTGTFTATNDFTVNTTTGYVNWTFTSFSTSPGGVSKFRIYGWNASNSAIGTMRIDDLSLTATVTTTSPIIIDYPNALVGIGTTPTQKLDILGNVRINEGKLMIGNIPSTDISTKLTPYSLAVYGEAIFEKAKIKLYGDWPDFVFEKKYGLMSLQRLEQYIRLNKHLPNMLDAKQVAAQGIDIGSTQAALLQKVEELTLYVIDQNKKIERQQKQIVELQKKQQQLSIKIKR